MDNKENEQYFHDLFETFNTKGWNILMDEFAEQAALLNDLRSVQNEADLFNRQGQVFVLQQLVNLKETTENLQQEMENGDD